MATGPHRIEFEALEGWDRMPEGYAYVEVAGVACDSRDRVYVFIDDQDMVHIAEGGFHNYMMKRYEGPLPKHDQTMIYPPCGHAPIARVTVCDPDGNIAAQIGGENPVLPGNFIAPHARSRSRLGSPRTDG